MLALLILCVPARAHEITFSQVDLGLEEGRTRIAVQLPNLALLFEEPSPLPEGTTEEVLQSDPLPPEVQVALGQLLTERLLLRSGGESLPLTLGSVQSAGDRVVLTAIAPPATAGLAGEADLFPEDPLHKVFVDIYRGRDLVGQYALDREEASFALGGAARPLGEVIATFVREGIHHIFIGPDHILFVLALILLGGRLWAQVKIITTFTVAHSVTLTLATLEIVQLPSRLVESVIALSIVVVGLHDLRYLSRDRPDPNARDPRVAFAFLFGLVHGFGFASVLRDLDLPREALAWSLAAFNLGVEIGQVTIVLLAAPILLALRRLAPPPVARGVLGAAAGAVVAVGGAWLWQRALGD
jgi:hydrogenase/urease accessory protein HupE